MIQRYGISGDCAVRTISIPACFASGVPQDNGRFVLFSDHSAAIAAIQQECRQLQIDNLQLQLMWVPPRYQDPKAAEKIEALKAGAA